MRRMALFVLTALCGATALGAGLLDCIEPDVLRSLLLQGQGERSLVVTAAVPPEISALKMPREFSWIGSAERETGRVDANTTASQVTAAYRSNLAPDAARAAVEAALTGSGWEVRPMPGMNMAFTSAALQAQTACRDGKPVNVTVNAMDGTTYVLISTQRNAQNAVCDQPARPFAVASSGLNMYMPRLELPADPATGHAARSQSSGSSSGGNVVTARAEFAVKDSAGNVARHFARQMAEQGWSRDADWSGDSTAGSSWSRRPDANTLIHGTLLVMAMGDGQFMSYLRVQSLQ